MSPDLPEKLLGMSIDDPSDSRSRDHDSDETEDLERFVFLAIGDQRLAIPVDDVKTITNPPAELTRVPRSPEAVEGVVDFRGEITAVIEPRIHFPVDGDRSARQRLVVFDRPTDQQPAAIRVDDVIGVENVPASNVLDEDDLEDDEGDALEHPLVVALVKQERTIGPRSGPADADDEGASADAQQSAPMLELGGRDGNSGSGSNRRSSSSSSSSSSDRSPHTSLAAARTQTSEEFDASIDQDRSEMQAVGSESGTDQETETKTETEMETETEVVVDTTPLVDVDRFLLASGYQE